MQDALNLMEEREKNKEVSHIYGTPIYPKKKLKTKRWHQTRLFWFDSNHFFGVILAKLTPISLTYIYLAKMHFWSPSFTKLRFWSPNFKNSTFDPLSFTPFANSWAPLIFTQSKLTRRYFLMFFVDVDIIKNKLNPALIIAIYNKRKKHKTMRIPKKKRRELKIPFNCNLY